MRYNIFQIFQVDNENCSAICPLVNNEPMSLLYLSARNYSKCSEKKKKKKAPGCLNPAAALRQQFDSGQTCCCISDNVSLSGQLQAFQTSQRETSQTVQTLRSSISFKKKSGGSASVSLFQLCTGGSMK